MKLHMFELVEFNEIEMHSKRLIKFENLFDILHWKFYTYRPTI